jgi:serine/threonine protein kinase
VKVLDFGLAKTARTRVGPDDVTGMAAALTSEGTILGTPQYMAPEQYEGKEANERSDIFAFGCVVYEMVTGKRCFDGKTKASLIAAVLGGEPVPMSALIPVTPPALERLVKRCLEKDPEDRYQSMRDVVLDLRSIGAVTESGRADRKSAPLARAVEERGTATGPSSSAVRLERFCV